MAAAFRQALSRGIAAASAADRMCRRCPSNVVFKAVAPPESNMASNFPRTAITGRLFSSTATVRAGFFRKYFSQHRLTEADIYAKQVQQGIEYKPIYIFNYIVIARTVQRLKVWFFYVFSSACCILMLQSKITDHPVDMKLFVGLVSSFCVALTSLIAVGLLFRKLIGRMYVSEDGQKMMISLLTFWGHRVNYFVQTKNVIPLDSMGVSLAQSYVPFKIDHRPDINWVYSIKYGRITDPIAFNKVFGYLDTREQEKLTALSDPFRVYNTPPSALRTEPHATMQQTPLNTRRKSAGTDGA